MYLAELEDVMLVLLAAGLLSVGKLLIMLITSLVMYGCHFRLSDTFSSVPLITELS